ncbi:hypothetical protein Tco_0487413 [Tanacetum coccineum]
MRQLSFEETELDEEAGFADVVRSGVESSGLSHDVSFGVDDLDLNLNEPVNLNVSQIKTQSELPVYEDRMLGNGQFFYDDEGIDIAYETQYDVQSSEDARLDDDDDFLVDEENEIVEPDVDVPLFVISIDVPFDNINGFDSDPGNDDKTSNYMRRRLAKIYNCKRGNGPIGPNCGMEARPSGSSTMSKKRKNTDIPIKAVQDQLQHDSEVQISMRKAFRAKAKAEREIREDHILQYYMLRDYVIELQSTNPNTTVKISIERNTDPSLPTKVFMKIYVCLGALKLGFRAYRRDLLGLDGAFIKGPFPGQVLAAIGLDSNNGIYPLSYALVEAESKSSWCWVSFQPLKLSASATSVKEFEKCMLELKKTNLKIMESIKKEAHFMKVQWNGANKYQVSGLLGDQSCWNMALNDRATPPPEAWVNPCYWLTTWRETYSHNVQRINGTNYWEKSTLLKIVI